MLFADLLSLHLVTFLMFFILVHIYASTALTDTATLRGSYYFYLLANDVVTEYLRNYNLTTPPYHYYQYIQS